MKVELMDALVQEFGPLRDPTLLELGLKACPCTEVDEEPEFPSPREFYGGYGVRPGRCMQATMSERQNTCPECNSLNVKTLTIHNPETSDLNATIRCIDCKHEWEGLVTSPRTEHDHLAGWGF